MFKQTNFPPQTPIVMTRSIPLFVTLLFLLPITLCAQGPTFQKAYVGGNNDIGIWGFEYNDGFVLAGRVRPYFNPSNNDGMLICTDKNGEIRWQKNYGGLLEEILTSAVETHDGGILAYGITGTTKKSKYDGWLVRTDSAGNLLWQKYLGRNPLYESPNAPIVSATDGYYLSGTIQEVFGSVAMHYGSYLTKVDSNGSTLWSRRLMLGEKPDSTIVQHFSIHHATDSMLYGSGMHGDIPVFMQLDPATGAIKHIVQYENSQYTLSFSLTGIRPTVDGNLAIMGYAAPKSGLATPDNPGLNFLLMLRPNGEVIWCKAYKPNFLWQGLYLFQFNTTSDGGVIVTLSEKQFNQTSIYLSDQTLLMKLDANGEVIWKKFYPIDDQPNNGNKGFDFITETSDKGFIAVGSISTGTREVLLMKTDASGETANCCSITRPNKGAFDFPIQTDTVGYLLEDYEPFVDTMLTPEFAIDFTAEDICQLPQPTTSDTVRICPGESATIGDSVYSQPTVVYLTLPSASDDCDTLATVHIEHLPVPTVTKEIDFCPGDTVWVNGQYYTEADTLYGVLLPAAVGCDTVATFVLRDNSAATSSLVLNCPADVKVLMPIGTDSVAVLYDAPTVSSDCDCPGYTLIRTAGGESGSYFAPGNHQICYAAADACGNAQSCCFNIRVEKEASQAPCDVKTSGCMRFEVLQVSRDADQHWVYDIRVTNNCSDAVKYLYLQVPKGLYADEPTNQTGYTSPDGLAYAVRNPNFSPFYSIRFQPQGSGLANGESDVFRFALPAQASMRYIQAAARLSSGAYIETHLNTFNCPVGAASQSKPRAEGLPLAFNETLVYPNPLSAEAMLTIRGVDTEGCVFVLTDLTGRVVLETPIVGAQAFVGGAVLPNGIYFFRIQQPSGGCVGSGKVAVLR
jgi:hypothetical protein